MGCDTFVVLSSHSLNGNVIFGKNSDRPQGEVQEVVYFPGKTIESDTEELEVTYIRIPEVKTTRAVILSKPAWMWGAEMGANDLGVVIGNEAVFTKLEDSHDIEERLLGMDLVRLGLERSDSAEHAVDVITQLLETHGQGGPCSDTDVKFTYHNSFLIADPKEAWVLETAGAVWAAERITEGFRNISNSLSISTKIDKMSSNLKKTCIDNKLWDGKSEFNFKKILSIGGDCDRYTNGKKLLQNYTAKKDFSASDMMNILRDKPSGINRSYDDAFATAASQVSVLSKYSSKFNCHWLTATPDPSISLFKPFIFANGNTNTQNTTSPLVNPDPSKTNPRFQFRVDRAHPLYISHREAYKNEKFTEEFIAQIRKYEKERMTEIDALLLKYVRKLDPNLVNDIFQKTVERELQFYA